jgi:ABC-type transporter Mla MlaB component
VAFSLFGKKSEPPKKTDSKPAPGKAPAAKPPAKSSPASPAPRPVASAGSGDESLDFSSYTPPPKTELPEPAPVSQPPAAEKAVPVPQAPPVVPAVAAPTPAPAPKPAAPPPKPSAPPPVPAPAAPHAPAPSPRRTTGEDVPVIEDAAVLFANGQVSEALAKLERAVRGANLAADALQAWLMLFDLYQDTGKRVEFEALALEFTVKFERSPPIWIEAAQEEDPALATGGVGYCAVSGTLSEASAPALGKLRDAATRQRTVRLDFTKLQGLDGPGCGVLRETLLAIRDAGTEVILSGEAQLLKFLEEACQAGMIQTDGTVWALLLDIHRMLGLQEKFEEVAVNYAVTFEVSPPSWEAPRAGAVKRAASTSSKEASEQALVLSGELTGADPALAKQLQEWASANHMLVVDMSRTRRVDFVTAGLMFNVMSKLHQAGTTIQIKGANQLVNALFGVMGIGQVARIIPRK